MEESFSTIKSLLHLHTNNIRTLLESQRQMISFLAGNPLRETNKVDFNFLQATFSGPAKRLLSAIKRIIEDVNGQPGAHNLSEAWWDKLINYSNELEQLISDFNIALPLKLRDLGHKILVEIVFVDTLSPKAYLKKEMKKQIRDEAKEVIRLTCLYDLMQAHRSAEMTNNELLSIIGGEKKEKSKRDIIDVTKAVNEIVSEYKNAANRKEIHLKLRDTTEKTFINCSNLDFKKAVGNLLDNAIKYTGILPFDSKFDKTWIEIRLRKNNHYVSIIIESWGTPITEEELNSDLIFKMGYRGRFAHKSGIPGTGTGLSDVRNFALTNGGTVIYDTQPVKKTEDIFKAIKTTVILNLPLANL